MTQQQIEKAADKSIKFFEDKLPWGSLTESRYYKLCVECAIEKHNCIVKELNVVKIVSNSLGKHAQRQRILFHKSILKSLKKRL